MNFVEIRIFSDSDEKMEETKAKIIELLMKDDSVYDFNIIVEGKGNI